MEKRLYTRLIGSIRWLRLRKQTLARHPYCQRCEEEGRTTLATEVHHVVPCEYAINQHAMEQLMFDPNNLRCLCHDCHVKTHVELGRSGKEASRRINQQRMEMICKKFF